MDEVERRAGTDEQLLKPVGDDGWACLFGLLLGSASLSQVLLILEASSDSRGKSLTETIVGFVGCCLFTALFALLMDRFFKRQAREGKRLQVFAAIGVFTGMALGAALLFFGLQE